MKLKGYKRMWCVKCKSAFYIEEDAPEDNFYCPYCGEIIEDKNEVKQIQEHMNKNMWPFKFIK